MQRRKAISPWRLMTLRNSSSPNRSASCSHFLKHWFSRAHCDSVRHTCNAPAKRLGDVHQLFGEFRQLLRHIHFVAFGRDILPDRLAAARIEQQAAQESALAVGDQAGELSRCPGEQQGERGESMRIISLSVLRDEETGS